ncbi:hypothetical protein [Saccharopolyspora oryzae]|uniref:ATP-binding protein n=1 Tax=Saccharopolyspora oryzae TaxID=2997343 RepID=A0ABT4USW8_9PSEU|nr:hypothetical protein [Saccharopolyspora oryzae]MDA3624803.1 hypothetical protein [Saccharopolyspora oryzae]
MKRTFAAAAAVLAGGAGVVGFAGVASAEGTPQLPAELPTDNNLAQTTFHAAGTVASAQQTVGDVVPLDEELTGRSALDDPARLTNAVTGGMPITEPFSFLPNNGGLGDLAGKSGTGSLDAMNAGQLLPQGLGGLVEGATGAVPVGGVVPVG